MSQNVNGNDLREYQQIIGNSIFHGIEVNDQRKTCPDFGLLWSFDNRAGMIPLLFLPLSNGELL